MTTTDPTPTPTQAIPAQRSTPEPPGLPYAQGLPTPLTEQLIDTGQPARKRSGLRDFIALAIILVVVVGLLLGIDYFNRPAPEPAAASTGCDPALVQVSPMYHGVSLFVTTSGPDVVSADVWDGFVHRRMSQQVTKRGGGATISMWDFAHDIQRITVTTKTGGTCEASTAGLNR